MSSQQRRLRPPCLVAELSLSSQLRRLKDLGPTVQRLARLQGSINRECFSCSRPDHSANPNLSSVTIEIALYLSSPLVQWSGADSSAFREVQLRALVAAFALLHHIGVTKLSADLYDKLRSNVAGRFSDIIDGRRDSQTSLEGRMKEAHALYLIRLVAQYFFLFKRAQPHVQALSKPILGLALAGVSIAGGQYNALQAVFYHANQFIGLIPARKSRHLNLPAVQELTRRAITSLGNLESDGESVGSNEHIGLVQKLLNDYVQKIPSKKKAYWDWPLAQLRQGPPMLNEWYFFYGLLDCGAQIARHARPGQLSDGLLNKLKHLMTMSEFEEFRWKIVEIFLAYASTRGCIGKWQRSLHRALHDDHARVVSELEAVKTVLGQATVLDCVSNPEQPLERDDLSPQPNAEREGQQFDEEEIQSLLGRELSGATTPSSRAKRESTTSATTGKSQPNVQTDEIEPSKEPSKANARQYVEKDLRRWRPIGEPEVYHLLPPQGIVRRTFARGFTHSGLSPDCGMSFFHNSSKVCVYRLACRERKRNQPRGEPIFEDDFDQVVDVSLSERLLAVSTRQGLKLHRIQNYRSAHGKMEVPHDDWDPSGLAIYEQHSAIFAAIGHRRHLNGSREGRVTIYKVRLSHCEGVEAEAIQNYTLPMHDVPKNLLFDSEQECFTCITDIKNVVLVWKLKVPEPVVIRRYDHRPETDSNGVTSAVLYRPLNERTYVFCSTSASTERYRSKGEWSFSSPVAARDGEVPSSSVHDFVALETCRQLVASAVSSVANIYAVLEKTGRILVMQLTAHKEGGISIGDRPPQRLRASLCNLRSSKASTTCMRFDPSGKMLYAVDPEGKLLVVTFEPED